MSPLLESRACGIGGPIGSSNIAVDTDVRPALYRLTLFPCRSRESGNP